MLADGARLLANVSAAVQKRQAALKGEGEVIQTTTSPTSPTMATSELCEKGLLEKSSSYTDVTVCTEALPVRSQT